MTTLLNREIEHAEKKIKHLRKSVITTRLTYLLYLALLIMNGSIIYYGHGNIGTGISIGMVSACWLFMIFTCETNMIDYKHAKEYLLLLEKFKANETHL